MAPFRAAALAVLAPILAVREACALKFDAASAKEYPVSKVVTLLKDMQTQLEKEADADEEVYEKLACWCETNNKGKTKAIADAEARISDLDATVEKMASLSETLKVEIKGLEKEIAANKKSLETATALRTKQKAEFVAEEKEMIESIRALNSAIVVLSKHHEGKGAAFLNNKVVLNALAIAKAQMDKHAVLLQGTITPSQKRALSSFAQGEDYFDAKPTFNQAYAPQSGQIFGILKQMKETFEGDLSGSQKEEIASQKAYDELKEAKETEIAAGEASLDAKTQQLASTDETLAQAKEEREDTYASMGADKKFLMELKVKCAMTDKEWEERQKLRQSELVAVAKAISILSSDDARDMFSKTFNPESFVQVRRKTNSDRRAQAVNALRTVASSNPKIAAIATAMRLDPFPKVKKAIDDMVSALLKEKEDEIEHKAYCTDEFHENEKSTQKKLHTKTKLENKIAALETTIKEQTAAIETLTSEITDLEAQRKRAGEDRKAERAEYEGVIADQKETQSLLNQALSVLKDVYSTPTLLLQKQKRSGQAPPPGFSEYGKQEASTGILMMIEQIIADAKAMEAEATHAEQNAQDAYTKFVQTTNESIKAKTDAKTDLEGAKADSKKEKTEAEVAQRRRRRPRLIPR